MSPIFRSPRQTALQLLALSLVALFLRLHGLADAPLNPEEKWTLVEASGFSFIDVPAAGRVVSTEGLARWVSVRAVLHRIAAFDQPVFVLLTRGAITILGSSEWTLRLLPVVAGSLSPLLLFVWARRVVDESAAMTAAALLAVHPFHVSLSQMARVYTVSVACLLAVYLIPHHWKGRRVFSPMAAAFGFQPLTHMLSGFALLPHLLYLRLVARIQRRHLLASAAVGAILLACALPFGLADSILSEHTYTGIAHRGVSGPMSLAPAHLAATTAFSIGTLLGISPERTGLRTRVLFPLIVVALALCVRGAGALPRTRRAIVVCGAVLPTCVALALSFAYDHTVAMLPRYSIWALPFILVLLALGLGSSSHPRIVVGIALALFGALALSPPPDSPGYRLTDAEALARCSSHATPIVVREAVDGFVAGVNAGNQAFFTFDPKGTGAFQLGSAGACRAVDVACDGVQVCSQDRPRVNR